MRNKIIVVLLLVGFLASCKLFKPGKCGTCPTFDRKEYKKKHR